MLSKVGRYDILAAIGRGGAGAVYRARSSSGDVAIKILSGVTADALARFERERRLQAAFGDAEGFVPLLDSGFSPEGAYLVMPLLTGGTLRERLERGPMAVEDAVALTLKLARALAHAHARGVVHRDVKPENVLFTARGEPLVADLGLAKHFDHGLTGASQSVNLSTTGTFYGTAGYMPIEQMRDSKAAGPSADVFALGAILHECLAGQPAFSGESLMEVLARVEAANREPLESLRFDVPPWLLATVARALAHEPAKRFADASGLAAALEAREVPSAPTRRPRRRGAVLLLVLATGAAFFFQWSRRGETGSAIEAAAALGVARHLASRFTALGEDLVRAGDPEKGIIALTQALALDPTAAGTWSDLGGARFNSGDFAGATRDCTKALELDPTLVVAWTNRGESRWSNHDLPGAIEDLTRAAELSPGSPEPLDRLGWAKAMHNDLLGAEAALTKAIALDASRAIVWYHRGWARERLGDHDGAIADQTKALDLDPADTQALIARAVSHEKKQDRQAAIQDFTRVTELAPGEKLAFYLRANLLEETGDHQGAIRDYTRVLTLTPDDSQALKERAQARLLADDVPGAIRDYERYLELVPDALEADSLRAKLIELRRGR